MGQPQKVHQARKCPKLEDLEEGEEYSFTLSPPDLRNRETAKANSVTLCQDYQAKLVLVKEIINKFYGSKLVIYPELSPMGRLHFHGLITITNTFDFYYHDLYLIQDWCFEMDTIGVFKPSGDTADRYYASPTERKKWLDYCQKQSHVMGRLHDKLGEKYPVESGYHKIVTTVNIFSGMG